MCTITTILPIPVVSPYDGCVSTIVRTDRGADHFIQYSPDHHKYAVGRSVAEYRQSLPPATALNCPICGASLHATSTSVHCYNFTCRAQVCDVFHRHLALLGMPPPPSVCGYAPYLSAYLDEASSYGQTLRQRLRDLLTFSRLIPFLGLGHLMPEPTLDQPSSAAMSFVEFARRMRAGEMHFPYVGRDFAPALAITWNVNQVTLQRIETICLTSG